MSTFIKKGRNGQTRIWKIWVDGAIVYRESGQKGGKMIQTFDTPGAAGKVGTKAFVSANDRALERALYLTKKKKDNGYREIDPETWQLIEKEAAADIDWPSHAMPSNFEVGKPLDPKNKRDLDARDELVENARRRLITLKRDGLCYIVMVGDDNIIQIYSRKMERFTDHFPYIIKEIQALNFPPRTVLTCEFVIQKADGRDDRKAMQQLKGKADRTVKLQDNPLMRPTAVVLNTPYWAGHPVMLTDTVFSWMSTMHDFFEDKHTKYVEPIEVLYEDFESCKKFIVEKEYEGLVIYDKYSVFGDKAFNFRGTTERTPCFKWKPDFETDCVVIFNPDKIYSRFASTPEGGEWGTAGKVRDLPKNVSLFQYDKENNLVFLSNCGSGFSVEQRKEVINRAKDNNGMCGVAEIRYASRSYVSRGDDSNSLIEPIFRGWHGDKLIIEAKDEKLSEWT